jgi:hypothetical protein
MVQEIKKEINDEFYDLTVISSGSPEFESFLFPLSSSPSSPAPAVSVTPPMLSLTLPPSWAPLSLPLLLLSLLIFLKLPLARF